MLILAVFPLIVANDFMPERYQDSFVYSEFVRNEETPVLASLVEGYITSIPEIITMKQICPLEAQCVAYLKENGFDIKGNAIDLIPNTFEPCRGCAILLSGGKFGHTGIVYDYDQYKVCYNERNRIGCGLMSKNCLLLTNSRIRGYLTK